MEKWKLRDYLLSLRKKLPLPFRKGSVSIKRISHISQTVLPIRRIEVSNFGIDFIGIPCLIFQQFVPTIISVFNIPTKIVRYEKHDLPKTRSKLLKSRESELRNWETEKLRNWETDYHVEITCFVEDATAVFLLFKAYNGKIIINWRCKTTFLSNGPFISLVVTADNRGALVTVDSDIL